MPRRPEENRLLLGMPGALVVTLLMLILALNLGAAG